MICKICKNEYIGDLPSEPICIECDKKWQEALDKPRPIFSVPHVHTPIEIVADIAKTLQEGLKKAIASRFVTQTGSNEDKVVTVLSRRLENIVQYLTSIPAPEPFVVQMGEGGVLAPATPVAAKKKEPDGVRSDFPENYAVIGGQLFEVRKQEPNNPESRQGFIEIEADPPNGVFDDLDLAYNLYHVKELES